MEEGKEKMIGMVGTGIFHLAIILSLLFLYLTPTIPELKTEELEGVPVMFGNVADAGGNDEAFGAGNNKDKGAKETTSPNVVEEPVPMEKPTAVKPPKRTSESTQPSVTQDMEETIAVKEAKKKADEKKRKDAEDAKLKAQTDRVAQLEASKKGQISNQMSGLFGKGTGSGSRGESQGTGTQGVPTGNASHGKTSGVGGWGSFDLGGRSLGSGGLIKPSYSVDDYGTVVVDILVDSKGNVVEATIGRGTNTTSATLQAEAIRAAKRTKFNEVSGVVNQKGKITYKFNLN